jgi:ferredoxin
MSISGVIIEDGCISCEMCEQICPEVFEMQEIAVVKPNVDYNEFEAKVREAADSCPVTVITVE